MDQRKQERYLRAQNRVVAIKKFYQHVILFVVINCLISGFKIDNYMERGDTFLEALYRFDTYIVWLVWGFFLILQAVRTFKPSIFMGADWEERKIKEYMNEK